MTIDSCPECGNEFDNICNHWHRSSTCSYPGLDENLLDVIRGVVTLRGGINKDNDGRYPYVFINTSNIAALKRLKGILGTYVGVISKSHSPNQFSDSEKKSFGLKTITHPRLYREFVFPNDYQATSLYLKSLSLIGGRKRWGEIQFSLSNRHEIDFFSKAIENIPHKIYKQYDSEFGSEYYQVRIPKYEGYIEGTPWPRGWYNDL